MNIALVVERPTQFDVPFFRHAASDPAHRFKVIFTGSPESEGYFDPELGHRVSWGFDLYSGYDSTVAPANSSVAWWRRELTREHCDLVITNGYTQRGYIAAAWAACRSGIPAALRIDSVLFTDTSGRRVLKNLLFALILKRAYSMFLAASSLTIKYLQSYGVPESRMAFFPYAIDEQGFRAHSRLTEDERLTVRRQYGLYPNAPVVLCVAKLHPREAPWDVLKAIEMMPAERPWLAIAGDGPERGALERYVADHGLSQTRFLGYVPYGELPRLYAACDLFVHAAREERWGVSVAEAMACGLPVITSSRVGSGYDLVSPGKNGLRYESGSAQELAKCLPAVLAMDRAGVDSANQEILERWGYASTWQSILKCAEGCRRFAGNV